MNNLIAEIRSITDKSELDRWADSHIQALFNSPSLNITLRSKRKELRQVETIRAEAVQYLETVKVQS